MSDCIFCKIAKSKTLAKIELKTSGVVAFGSNAPVAEHHLLIIPKEHISSFTDLEENHKNIFMEMAKVAQKLIADKKIANGYKLIFNGGKYQSVQHIHWHLLGGKLEDEDDILNKT
jgi:histidine triad (HIT) family protein